MFSLFAPFFLFNSARKAAFAVQHPQNAGSLASSLLQRADACAGRNPRESAELRDAAKIYLSVTR